MNVGKPRTPSVATKSAASSPVDHHDFEPPGVPLGELGNDGRGRLARRAPFRRYVDKYLGLNLNGNLPKNGRFGRCRANLPRNPTYLTCPSCSGAFQGVPQLC
jgi:hypothetical protein